jgi:hypothetical protein
MKINSELGYEPVTYSELTNDEAFWAGCKSCVNYPILQEKGQKNCLCTAMLYDPAEKAVPLPAATAKRRPLLGFLQHHWLHLRARALRWLPITLPTSPKPV